MDDTSLVLAYLAGCMDSDGTFGVRKKGRVYQARIGLKQVTPQVPALLKETFGGSLMLQPPSVTRGRPLHHWEATNATATRAAAAMEPYLRIKREQALLLRYLAALKASAQLVLGVAVESQTGTGVHAIRRRVLSDAELQQREAVYLRMKELNRVGI